MGIVEKSLEEMINNMPPDLNKDEKMRYVYLYFGKKFKKDVNFFYGNDDRKNAIYNKDVDIKSKNSFSVICKSIAQIYLEAFRRVGIEAELIQNNSSSSPIKHVDLLAIGENDAVYHLNPMFDLFKIQMGCKTVRFANRTQKYPELNFSFMSDEKLKAIDDKLGYTWHGMYTDEFFDTLREEILNKGKFKRHLKEVFPNFDSRNLTRDFCTQYKLEFILQHLDFSNCFSGYIEAKNYYDYIRKNMFNRTEQKNISRRTICKKNEKGRRDYFVLFDFKNSQDYHTYYIVDSSGKYNKTTDIVEFMSSNDFQFIKDSSDELELGDDITK